MNVQFAIKDGDIYILEVNPRASRTVPFVAKVIGKPIAGIAAAIMAASRSPPSSSKPAKLDHVAVKEAVFPFARFPGVDPILGPEMRSTGEVMGIDRDFAMAFAKSQLGAGNILPLKGTVFVSVQGADKERIVGARARARGHGLPDPRHARHQARTWRPTASPASRSTRCSRAARTSSTDEERRRRSWFSTPPKAPRRWPTARTSGAPPCFTTFHIIQL